MTPAQIPLPRRLGVGDASILPGLGIRPQTAVSQNHKTVRRRGVDPSSTFLFAFLVSSQIVQIAHVALVDAHFR